MRIVVIIVLLIFSFVSFGQEVKLGLPVGHTNEVLDCEFSPDGKFLLTCGADMCAILWEVSSGKCIYRLNETNTVLHSKFNPIMKQILTASGNNIKLWSLNTGLVEDTLIGHTSFISAVSFNFDGSKILSASNDSTVKLWDSSSGELLFNLKGHNGIVTSAQFSPSGDLLLTSSIDSTAKVWNSKTGKLICTVRNNNSIINASFSPDGNYFLTASADSSARVYDYRGSLIRTLKHHKGGLTSAEFNPNGKYILTASKDSTLYLWNVKNGQEEHVLSHGTPVRKIKFIKDGEKLLSLSYGELKVWDVASGELDYVIKTDKQNYLYAFLDADFNAKLNIISTTSFNRRVCLWDAYTGDKKAILGDYTSFFTSFDKNKNNEALISTFDSLTFIFNLNNGRFLKGFDGHKSFTRSSKFSNDEQLVVTSSWDSTSIIWDVNTEKNIKLKGHSSTVLSSIFSPNDKILVSISQDSTAKIWNVKTGNLIKTLKGHLAPISHVSFSSSGDNIVTGSTKGEVIVWKADNGKQIHSFKSHTAYITSVKFTNNDDYVLTSSYDASVCVWSLKTGKLIRTLKGHKYSVTSVSTIKDDDKIITTSLDGECRLWNIETGECLYVFKGHNKQVHRSEVALKSDMLLTLSRDAICLWNLSNGRLMKKLSNDGAFISCKFSTNEDLIYSTAADGSLSVWEINSGQELIRYLVFNNDPSKWVHLHPSGLFDASPEAMELMYWTKGLDIIEFSQLKERYWVPGLWEKVMSGEKLPDVRGMQELKLQPKVKFGELKNEKLPIKLIKRDGGYGKVSIFINGKEVINDARGNDLDTSKTEQTIFYSIKNHPYLVDGENKIEVKASSADGFVQGRGELFKTIIHKTKREPQFFGVVVGVSEYMNSNIDLKYPVNDAKAMSTSLQLGAENLFGEEKTFIYSITSEEETKPTKENIESVFKKISEKAKPEDIIVIYLSGHGVTWGGEQGDFYFLTSDATAANKNAYSDPVIRANNTISTVEWVELLKSVSALKQVMIIDACGSGKAVDNLIASRNVEASQIKAIDRMKDRTGMYIISGCTADAVSYEASQYGQGLLTYSILEAMKGAAIKTDGSVDVDLMMQHARERVPNLAKGVGGIQQPQLLAPKGGSFDIGILNEVDKKAIPLASPKRVFVRSTLVDSEEFEDVLGLSDLLDEQLISISSKGTESNIVYFDAKKYPNACKISGGYTLEGEVIELSLKIRCGEELEKVELEANSKEELVKEILKLVE